MLPSEKDTIESKKILDNLTGGQIQQILDYLIENALTPIIHNSDVFDAQIVLLLSMVTKNKKRKLSALSREEFINILCQYLTSTSKKHKVHLIQQAKIERGFIYNFISRVLVKLEPFLPLYYEWLLTKDKTDKLRLEKKLTTISRSVNMTISGAYTTALNSPGYLNLMYEFRNTIVTNYTKYAYKHAKIYCMSKSASFDFNDVWHNFLTSITKAIDKYDCSKGALTSYIKWWILNVQNSSSDHGHEYGIAYTIPQLYKKSLAVNRDTQSVNFGVSFEAYSRSSNTSSVIQEYATEESCVEDRLEKLEIDDKIRYLIKKADLNCGLARLYLDIPEFFTNKEKRKMVQIMKTQGTYDEDDFLKNCKDYNVFNTQSEETK